jgi:hypothetical protein
MYYGLIVWDDADDPDGNDRHIVATGLVTTEEVEDVLNAPTDLGRKAEALGDPSSSRQLHQVVGWPLSSSSCPIRTSS